MNKREWMLQAALAVCGSGLTDINVIGLSGLYDAICAASPETPQEGAWVEHDGDVSKAPDEGRMVEYETREGKSYEGQVESLAWDHLGDDGDIVRWRYA